MQKFILKIIKESDYLLILNHKRLCLPIINRIYKEIIYAIKFDVIKVYVKLIIDSHHRYVRSLFAKIRLNKVKSSKIGASIEHGWKDVEFVAEGLATEDETNSLNKLEAEFKYISLEKLIELIK
jgi:hypothetical protein